MIKNCDIKKCDCTHEYQDSVYGKNNRVFNVFGKNNDKVRCTVCGKEYSADGATSSKAKKKS
jgi:hypothetical protein